MAELQAHSSPTALGGFELLFAPMQRLRLRTIVVPPPAPSVFADRPLLLVANHVSWWDGFLLRDLHRRLTPRAPLYTLMLERELERFPFFKLLGALPITSSTRGVLRAFRSLERVRDGRPHFCISYFPQGVIRPSWSRPLGFRRGIELLIHRLAPCTVLPVALHIEPLAHMRPTAFVVAGTPFDGTTSTELAQVEDAVTVTLDRLLDEIAEHAL